MGPNWISEGDQICIINPHPSNFRNKHAKELLNVGNRLTLLFTLKHISKSICCIKSKPYHRFTINK